MGQLLCILLALIVGYLSKKLPISMNVLNKTLLFSVILILFIMGYNFGSEANFLTNILKIFKIVNITTLTLIMANFIFLTGYSKMINKSKLRIVNHTKQAVKFRHYIFESGKYLSYIILGVLVGYIFKAKILHLELIINLVLLIILFIIGFQLRQQNIALKTVFLNKIGVIVAGLVIISSILSGIISAKILGININTGLVLSSGYGWYTLSGILSGQLINPQIGAASFFIDFLREIIAIIIIPSFSRINPLFCIGYSGATALDFTLPVIKVNMGENYVPLAITSGMILTILVPVLIPLLWNL